MFTLDKKLKEDTFFIADLKISQLLLMNDANYLWFILVPKKPDLTELSDLLFEDQIELLYEINFLSKILKESFAAEKLNIASLGNVVKQLHIHVIGRKKNDASFPKPVWGNSEKKIYNEDSANLLIKKIQSLIADENKNLEDDQEIKIKKLLYRSKHRGCKETDILLGKFFEKEFLNLDKKTTELCLKFIEEDDAEIYNWVLGKEKSKPQYFELVEKIKNFHSI